ncbi:hypothetical protein R9C00_14700 [Flammeovirgaceae bacterium SG7u.111]|nr:hypothetical protein [Flammeovirgaceae bacterium SG7u.132]WPO38708.1 hypothetical protein R9C00_14700 [Flammeovirgaceae bacterium SG7u.111]
MRFFKHNQWLLLILGAAFLFDLVFFFLIYPALPSLFDGSGSDSLLSKLVHVAYPRFEVERHRFPAEFFIQKAEQVCWRFNLSALLLALFFYLPQKFPSLKKKAGKWWNGDTSVANVHFLRIVFFLAMLGFTFDWYTYLNEYGAASAFYKPVLLFKLLHLPYPSPIYIKVWWVVYWLAILLTFLDIKSWVSSSVAAGLFFLFHGYLQSFEKISHAYAAFGYAAMLMPFLFFQQKKAVASGEKIQEGWALKLIQLAIVFAYFFAGLEKVLTSGVDWLDGSSILHYAQSHGTSYGENSFLNSLLNPLMAMGAVALQLTFPVILVFPRLRYFYLPFGAMFHIGTVLTVGVGSFVNPWVFCYLFFFDWSRVGIFWLFWREEKGAKG